MDRLSSYAAREAASETPEEKQKKEIDAAAKMLEKMKLSKEAPPPVEKEDQTPSNDIPKENGHSSETIVTVDVNSDAPEKEDTAVEGKPKGIPEDVRLYEVFYHQVVKLVNVGQLITPNFSF